MVTFARRSRCKETYSLIQFPSPFFFNATGDVQQAQVRRHEEGVRAVGAVRLRNRLNHLQQQ